jgi:hypothetical protein
MIEKSDKEYIAIASLIKRDELIQKLQLAKGYEFGLRNGYLEAVACFVYGNSSVSLESLKDFPLKIINEASLPGFLKVC